MDFCFQQAKDVYEVFCMSMQIYDNFLTNTIFVLTGNVSSNNVWLRKSKTCFRYAINGCFLKEVSEIEQISFCWLYVELNGIIHDLHLYFP